MADKTVKNLFCSYSLYFSATKPLLPAAAKEVLLLNLPVEYGMIISEKRYLIRPEKVMHHKMKKLVFIEGVSGAGKSTLMQNLAGRLCANGTNVRAWVEFDHTNPIDFYCTAALSGATFDALTARFPEQREALLCNAILAGNWRLVRYYHGDDPVFPQPLRSELAAHELCYHPSKPVSLETYSEIFTAVWRSFAARLDIYEEDFLLFDGSLLHHPINDMLRNYRVTEAQARRHVTALLAALGSVPRQILYIQTEDIPVQLAKAHAERGQPAPTREEAAFWETRRRYDSFVLSGLSEHCVFLDPAQGWDRMTQTAASSMFA